MITKAFETILKSLWTSTLTGSQTSRAITLPTIKDVSGNNQSQIALNSYLNLGIETATKYSDYVTTNNYNKGAILWIGTGTSTPNKEDYTITPIADSAITIGTGGQIPQITKTINDNNNIVLNYQFTFTIAATDEDITITEIGLFKSVASASGSVYPVYMLDRQLLAERITVTAGTSITKTFSLAVEL